MQQCVPDRGQMHSGLTLIVPPVAAPVCSQCLRRQHLPPLLPTVGHGPPVPPRVDLQPKAAVASTWSPERQHPNAHSKVAAGVEVVERPSRDCASVLDKTVPPTCCWL